MDSSATMPFLHFMLEYSDEAQEVELSLDAQTMHTFLKEILLNISEFAHKYSTLMSTLKSEGSDNQDSIFFFSSYDKQIMLVNLSI